MLEVTEREDKIAVIGKYIWRSDVDGRVGMSSTGRGEEGRGGACELQ
jgi:hypothetical protein